MNRLLTAAAIAAIGLSVSAPASAQMKPEDVIKLRKSIYTVVAHNVRPIAAMAKGERPVDAALVARNAAVIEALSKQAPDGFAAGSDKGAETRAKPEIWSQPDKFKVAMDRFQGEATKMVEVARGGNADAIKTQFGALSKSCGACHDDFRNK